MAATCATSILAFTIALAHSFYTAGSFEVKHVYGMLSAIALAPLMYRGVQIYSMAFVASIYEGFFNWYIDEKHNNQVNKDASR
jgi:hypothetical protein